MGVSLLQANTPGNGLLPRPIRPFASFANRVLDGRAPSLHGLLWRARISPAAGDHLSFVSLVSLVSLVSFVSHVAYIHGERERGRPSRPSNTHQSKTWAPDSVGARAVERMWGGPCGSPAY